jgi:hypothetical protein
MLDLEKILHSRRTIYTFCEKNLSHPELLCTSEAIFTEMAVNEERMCT